MDFKLLLTVAEVLNQDPNTFPSGISNEDFYRGYHDRLEAKLKEKKDQITRAKRLVDTVSDEQRPMFEALLVQTEVQRGHIETELRTIRERLGDSGTSPS